MIFHNSMMMTLTMMIHNYDADFVRNMFTICKGKEAQSQEPSYASISKMIFTASLSLWNVPASPAHQTISFGRLILRNDCDVSGPTYGKGKSSFQSVWDLFFGELELPERAPPKTNISPENQWLEDEISL